MIYQGPNCRSVTKGAILWDFLMYSHFLCLIVSRITSEGREREKERASTGSLFLLTGPLLLTHMLLNAWDSVNETWIGSRTRILRGEFYTPLNRFGFSYRCESDERAPSDFICIWINGTDQKVLSSFYIFLPKRSPEMKCVFPQANQFFKVRQLFKVSNSYYTCCTSKL